MDAIYSEYNPGAIAVGSFLEDKEVLNIYVAGVVSPLENDYTYKTYIDYKQGCKEISETLKDKGIKKIGMLKVNQEFAELCKIGLKEVYPDLVVESYNPGETNLRTALLKLTSEDSEAIVNVAFPDDTLTSIRQLRELGSDIIYAGVSDGIPFSLIEEKSPLLDNIIVFGMPDVSEEFALNVGEEVLAYPPYALGYLHTKQIVRALVECDKDLVCSMQELDSSKPDSIIGFQGFNDRVAIFDMPIQEWNGNEFVDI